MPNPYHFRANMDRLWRLANSGPAYKQLNALDALVREMHAPNERARRNYQLYLATDPYDVARHLLRDLHDRAAPAAPTSGSSFCPPLPLGEGWGEGSPAPQEEAPTEDADPL